MLLKQLQSNPSDEQTLRQVITMLESVNGKYATAEWKRNMTELVLYLSPRNDQIFTLAEQSAMLQGASFQKQLKGNENQPSKELLDRAETRKSTADATWRGPREAERVFALLRTVSRYDAQLLYQLVLFLIEFSFYSAEERR